MINPDDLSLMTEREKLDLLSQLAETEEWQEAFEPLYRTLMEDESPKVRQEAIAALWDLADPRDIEPLMAKAEDDPDVEVRGKAVSVLGIYIYESVVHGALDEAQYLSLRAFLLDMAQDPREELLVRRMAIEALSFDADETVHELIDWAYHHDSVDVRMTAIFAMGRSRSARWTETIMAELNQANPKLLLEAVNASAEAALIASTPRLRNLVNHPDREVRVAAVWALARTGGPGAIETLEMCSQSSDPEVRDIAHDALEELYHSRVDEEDDDDDTDSDGSDYD
jgi:HEAT repeat protein